MYARTLLGRVAWAVVIGAVVGIAILLAGRLTGKLGVVETRWALAIGPAAAALLTLVMTRMPARRAAASEVDRASDTGDLFLTAVSLEADAAPTAGLSPVVRSQADRRAADLDPAPIVRPWERVRGGWVAAALVAVFAADFFTPVMDPFGVVAAAEAAEKQKIALRQDMETIRERKAQLSRRETEKDLSPEVDEAIQDQIGRASCRER